MYNAMELILWGRDREELPALNREAWRRVAAKCYRDALLVSHMIPTETKWIRLICGSLTVRAMTLGYNDLATQYHSRYKERAGDIRDSNEDLVVAMDHIIDMEDSQRAHIADYPRG